MIGFGLLHSRLFHLSKGNQVNIPEPYCGYFYGNINEPGNINGGPRKSSLFFLTVSNNLKDNPGSRSTGDGVERLGKHLNF